MEKCKRKTHFICLAYVCCQQQLDLLASCCGRCKFRVFIWWKDDDFYFAFQKKHIFLLVVETLLFIHIHFFSSLVFRLKRMEKKEKKLCGLLLELTSIYLWHHHKSKHLLHGILILLWSIRFFIFRQIHLKNVYILRCGNDEHWTPIKKTECI